MSNQLVNILRQNDLNTIILKKLKDHSPNIGECFEGQSKEAKLPQYIIDNMNVTAKDVAELILELNKVFIEKNITANSAESYIRFLCDLLPEYMLAPTYEELDSLSKEEIEAIVITQTNDLTIAQMKAGLIEHNYLNQGKEALDKEKIVKQFSELDDGTIKDAFKTLLYKQFLTATQTGATNG